MIPDAHKKLERYRIVSGPMASGACDGNNGAFILPIVHTGGGIMLMEKIGHEHAILTVIVSDEEWDHVSVSLPNRVPSWAEMCFVKDLFFDPEEPAMQLHPPRSKYINHHPNVLHLWRPHNRSVPMPPLVMV